MDCIFCRIIARALPAEILYESARVISILDINPIHHGHALVIPKAHCADFLAVPEEDLHEVLRVTQIVARALVDALRLDGFNIFSNNGRIAGQSVFHFHMHVTPRYPDDDIRFVLKLKSYTGGSMAEYAAKIRRHLPELPKAENIP
ncbi:MAG TPA: HIT family protein [Bacteroidota bacterium]|nr:HIT family protein [Bacteroidota bacterium]